ncbi:putative signal peptide protein [Puccinia sorghi]|uniref:Putative signal peptide protein n=1 Tax=Puccinia sorghi TaxID=27349 RepID=A0A0L6US79_9BASI|nr:putative signal peptide protein [Puccinia sorghi]
MYIFLRTKFMITFFSNFFLSEALRGSCKVIDPSCTFNSQPARHKTLPEAAKGAGAHSNWPCYYLLVGFAESIFHTFPMRSFSSLRVVCLLNLFSSFRVVRAAMFASFCLSCSLILFALKLHLHHNVEIFHGVAGYLLATTGVGIPTSFVPLSVDRRRRIKLQDTRTSPTCSPLLPASRHPKVEEVKLAILYLVLLLPSTSQRDSGKNPHQLRLVSTGSTLEPSQPRCSLVCPFYLFNAACLPSWELTAIIPIQSLSAERWQGLTLALHWRYSICLMSLGFLIVSAKWLIDSIRNCPDKAEGYSIREERQRSLTKKPAFIYLRCPPKIDSKALQASSPGPFFLTSATARQAHIASMFCTSFYFPFPPSPTCLYVTSVSFFFQSSLRAGSPRYSGFVHYINRPIDLDHDKLYCNRKSRHCNTRSPAAPKPPPMYADSHAHTSFLANHPFPPKQPNSDNSGLASIPDHISPPKISRSPYLLAPVTQAPPRTSPTPLNTSAYTDRPRRHSTPHIRLLALSLVLNTSSKNHAPGESCHMRPSLSPELQHHSTPCQITCQNMPGDMQLNCVLLWCYSILLKILCHRCIM